MNRIWIIAPVHGGQVSALTWDLIQAALGVQSLYPSPMTLQIIAFGHAPHDAAQELAQTTGSDVLALDMKKGAGDEALKTAIYNHIARDPHGIVLFADTLWAGQMAPALAVLFSAPAITHVSGMSVADHRLVCTRPVMDSTRVHDVGRAEADLVLITLAPGQPNKGLGKIKPPGPGRVTQHPVFPDKAEGIRRITQERPSRIPHTDLNSAAIVVAAGRGIGARENLELVQRFADSLPNAALAVSRPLVDLGWADYSRQVGITGARVSPRLYIALGISGSSQHLAGMCGSQWVVSINQNPDAPIVRHADVYIQADAVEFLQTCLKDKK